MTTYTDEQRQAALDAYTEHGTAEAARITGIPTRTIRMWANHAGLTAAARTKNLEAASARLADRHAVMRQELRISLIQEALDALERIHLPHVEYVATGGEIHEVRWDEATAQATKAYMTAAAIAVDKYRLEMGEATERRGYEGEPEVDKALRHMVETFESFVSESRVDPAGSPES